jgi:sulfide dehydrogenase cytochrome subunit
MRWWRRRLLAAALLFWLGASVADADDGTFAEALADGCTSCHGIEGHSRGYIPSLDALSRKQFVQALREYREQKSPATIMNRIARTYSPAQIELLADYFTGPARQ